MHRSQIWISAPKRIHQRAHINQRLADMVEAYRRFDKSEARIGKRRGTKITLRLIKLHLLEDYINQLLRADYLIDEVISLVRDHHRIGLPIPDNLAEQLRRPKAEIKRV